MNLAYIKKQLQEVWTLNQTMHTYELAGGLENLMSEQTAALRRMFKEIEGPDSTAPRSNLGVDWTDVKELPDDFTNVLIACDDGEVDVAYHIDAGWIWLTGHDVEQTVIAWAHMPAGPADKEAAEAAPTLTAPEAAEFETFKAKTTSAPGGAS